MKSKEKVGRILLKISGEALGGPSKKGHDKATIMRIANEVKKVHDEGIEVAIVCGGGNICRGHELVQEIDGMTKAAADHVGMLATIQNALVLEAALESIGVCTRVLSAIEVRAVAEPFILKKALRHLEKKRVIICAGGTGNPGFSTDTAAITQAVQIRAEKVYKATGVRGVYSADPKNNPDAEHFPSITYDDFISRKLRALDLAAVALAHENKMPIVVFNINEPGNISKAILEGSVGTEIIV